MISVVVVTYNSSSTIEQCLVALQDSFKNQQGEIIVVDNNSQDNTVSIIRKNLGHEKLIYMPYNVGFAAGVNKGISHARGQYLLLANPDLIVNSECIQGMRQFLEANDDAGAVGPKLIYGNGERQPSCRRYPTLKAIVCSQISCLSKLFDDRHLSKYLMEDKCFCGPTEVEWLMGACIMLRFETLNEVGCLDERFFLYREDTDWCYRMRQKGKKVFYLPHLAAIHYYQRESSRGINRKLLWHLKSMFYFYQKHGFRIS